MIYYFNGFKYYNKMKLKTYKVSPIRRLAATIYDLFLLCGIWFAVGSIAVWINGGIIEAKWIGPLLVFISTWAFYCYFWIHGNKTLGMAIWKIEIYSFDGKNPSIKQATIRFLSNLVIVMLVGIPLLQIYFSAEGRSISDNLSNTGLRLI
jgi:uncharacterized RDD family membrane protein YckC